MSGVYYNPEEHHLEQIGCLDESGLSWEYNILVVLRHLYSERLYYAMDSG